MRRIALRIAYDGTGHAGWQTQPDARGIQDLIQAAVAAIAGHPVELVCAGRTDAGVHALGQIAHFDTTAQRPLQAWVRGVNAHLAQVGSAKAGSTGSSTGSGMGSGMGSGAGSGMGSGIGSGAGSIVVREAEEVEPGFHARFSAVARAYYYLIHEAPVQHPFWRLRSGWTHRLLEVERMREAAGMLIGTHDFSAFRSSQCQARSPCRRIEQVDLLRLGALIVLCIRANAFLHHMVRNIVGALVAIGNGSCPPAQMRVWLDSRDRSASPATFAAEGLYFAGALYPQDKGAGRLPQCSGLSPLQELLPGLASPYPENPTSPPGASAPADRRTRADSPRSASHRTLIKFCGIVREEDLALANALAVDYVGFVLYPRSPRALDVEAAAALRRKLASHVGAVGLFVNAHPQEVQEACRRIGLDVVQFHGDESPQQCAESLAEQPSGRRRTPGWRALRMRDAETLARAMRDFPESEAFLVDRFDPPGSDPGPMLYGGTGRRFDWGLLPAAHLRPQRLILSGGLDPANVSAAVCAQRPWAVDVSTGIQAEDPRAKDAGKMERFVAAVRAADQ